MSGAPDEVLLAALAGLLPDAHPPAARARALRARLLAAAGGQGARLLRAGEGAWHPFLPGISLRLLHLDEAAGTQTALWRLAPGAVVPPHPHSHEEECLVLEGSVVQEGVEFAAGDFLVVAAGQWHPAFRSPGGALLMIRGERLALPTMPGPARA